MPEHPRAISLLLGYVLFCSGGIALVYEVVWQRQFSLLFGSAAPASTAVLVAYFGGLGLGNFILGSRASRWSSPLAVYAVLELLIAAGALAVGPLLSLYTGLYPALITKFGDAPMLLLAIKGALAFLAVLVPTAAMGGTLPVLAELVDTGRERLGLSVGWLYVVNTAGAAAGALLFPFLLLRVLGTQATVLVCVTGNLVLAFAALWLRARWPKPAAPAPNKAPANASLTFKGAILLALVSGAGTFALQVLWNRAFAQVQENSIYSFARIVALFIFAVACGAQLARWFLQKRWTPRTVLGLGWVAGGTLIILAPLLFVQLTRGMTYMPAGSALALDRLLLEALLVFAPTALLGVAMPLLLQSAGAHPDYSAGSVSGKLLGMNIVGSVAGAFLAGFALPPLLGLWNSMIAAGATFAAIGAWLCMRGALRFVSLVVAIGFSFAMAHSDVPRIRLADKPTEKLLELREGAYGIVAVTERGGSRRLRLNNHYTLGGTFAVGDERTQAHIPLLLHPNPARVVFLGYGTGITAGGAWFHPIAQAQAVELVPEVIELAGRYFNDANNGFPRPGATTVTDDARNFLRGSPERFDVIVSDIVVPWQPGEAALYTAEHFAAAKERLAENGLFCAWVPLFQLGRTEFEILVRTFISVFGQACVWRGDFSPNRPALALIALKRPLDPGTIQSRLTAMLADPANPHLRDPRAFWMHFVGVVRSEDIAERRINSEDRPWLELLAPVKRNHEVFVGRKLSEWQNAVWTQTRRFAEQLSPEVAAGGEAGRLMVEFTLATFERDDPRATRIQAQIRNLLGPETYRLVFGVE